MEPKTSESHKRQLFEDAEPVKRMKCDNVSMLQSVEEVLEKPDFKDFKAKLMMGEHPYLEITRCSPDFVLDSGLPINFARIIIYENGMCKFNLTGSKTFEQKHQLTMKNLHKQVNNVLTGNLGPQWTRCTGISESEFKSNTTHLGYQPKHVLGTLPFISKHSIKCEEWIERCRKSGSNVRCKKCSDFLSHVKRLDRRNNISQKEKWKRQDPSSRFPHHLLSPNSKRIRQKRSVRRVANKEKVIKRLRSCRSKT